MIEQAIIDWDSTAFEPLARRVGIGHSSTGAIGTILAEVLRSNQSGLF